jgi:hypothetical protein
MRAPLYIIRFTMLNRETLHGAARHNRSSGRGAYATVWPILLKSGMHPSRANKRD